MESEQIRPLQKKRTTNFREDETKLLIQLWGSPMIQNKLYLTHRKAPVMRLLAANMQQRGFYRTPDEIKTRIRNLKCLYHRIKRTMACGTGIGTVDPDWPHFKAMDAILSKQGPPKKERSTEDYVLEGPRCEDIKQEVEIDINDDMDSWATNSMGSECDDDTTPPPPLTPAPAKDNSKKDHEQQVQSKPIQTIIPSFTLPTQNMTNSINNQIRPTGQMPSIPLPLLILNSLQPQNTQDKKDTSNNNANNSHNEKVPSDLNNILKELLEVQKENLDVEKQRLEMEKQKLEFERVVGSQLLTLVPMIGGLLQRLSFQSQDILNLATNSSGSSNSIKNGRKRQASSDLDMLKDNKILRTVLEQGIKKYMLGEDNENDDEKSTDNEDSGIQNDENSTSSDK